MLRPRARACARPMGAALVAIGLLVSSACSQDAPAPPSASASSGTTGTTARSSADAPGTSRPDRPTGTTAPDLDVAPIEWEPCGARRECATYPVPADHDDPTGPTVDLAVIRRPATGTDRIGSLFMNPGGPGGSGVDYIRASALDPTLNEFFDIVSWDPRGVGASDPIACDLGAEVMRELDWNPDTDEEQAQLDEAAEEIAVECGAEYEERLTQVATEDTVRDLDLLRQAVGDEQLTFLGFSYGTAIGLRYADRYPELVRAMVLDGVVDPTQDLEQLLTDQAVAFEASVDQAFASCAASATCPVADPATTFDRVQAAVETAPIPAAGQAPVGPTALAYAALSSAYDPSRAQVFIAALAAAEAGDGAPLRQLADLYWSSTSYSEYASVVCTDNPHPVGAEDFRAMTERMAAAAPRFGAAVASEMLPCAFWDAPVTGEPGVVVAEGAAPILVVGNTGDAATPYAAAQRVADDLDSGVLLTYRGTGHTSFNSDNCVRDVVRSYLVDLVVPPPGTECPTPR